LQLSLVVTLLQVHVHIKRHVMKNLPETDDAVAQWCKDAFVAKVVTVYVLHGFISLAFL
jgi:hypothetical protein